MSDFKFICPNCEKELTKIIHKVKTIPTILIDFEADIYKFLEISKDEHIEFRCPECDIKILPPLENELAEEINKSNIKPFKYRVPKQESIPFSKPKN
ncbi:hypothetical protein ES703_27091 [subsurface metagenome]